MPPLPSSAGTPSCARSPSGPALRLPCRAKPRRAAPWPRGLTSLDEPPTGGERLPPVDASGYGARRVGADAWPRGGVGRSVRLPGTPSARGNRMRNGVIASLILVQPERRRLSGPELREPADTGSRNPFETGKTSGPYRRTLTPADGSAPGAAASLHESTDSRGASRDRDSRSENPRRTTSAGSGPPRPEGSGRDPEG